MFLILMLYPLCRRHDMSRDDFFDRPLKLFGRQPERNRRREDEQSHNLGPVSGRQSYPSGESTRREPLFAELLIISRWNQ
jgi:hypothetical protein